MKWLLIDLACFTTNFFNEKNKYLFKNILGDFMENNELYRVIIVNFITSAIVSYVTCYFLTTYNIFDGIYLGNLLGVYLFSVFGINILVEARKIPNNYKRFIYAIIFITVFDFVFVNATPILFGANIFTSLDSVLYLNFPIKLSIPLTKEFYLALFGIVMLIFNYVEYRTLKREEI